MQEVLVFLFYYWHHKHEVREDLILSVQAYLKINEIIDVVKKGLFHRAIGESGSVLAEWALDRNGQGRVASLRIAEIAGCPLKPYEDLLNCVRNVDAGELTRAYGQYMVYFYFLSFSIV